MSAPDPVRGRTLAFLVAVFAVSFMDRQILSILAPSLQRELGLSDTRLGLLSGFAFAVFFTALGVPLAAWADRNSRKRLIAGSVAIFSLMTAACGLAGGFLSLLLARVGVAVGEAGTNPPSHSMIADLYAPEERARAMGIFALGPALGLFLGFLVGGGLDHWLGWRFAFLGAAVPGLLLAFGVARFVPEPERSGGPAPGSADPSPISFAQTVRTIAASPVLRCVVPATGLASAVGYGVVGWLPMFLSRFHGLSSLRIGLTLAIIVGIAGGLGTYAGGRYADRWSARDRRWLAGVPALAVGLSAPAWAIAFLVSDAGLATVLLVAPALLATVYVGPSFALVQNLVDARERAMAAAIVLFVVNLVGFGAGPVAIGALSDALAPRLGEASLRWALVGLSVLALASAALYARAARALGSSRGLAETGGIR